MTNLPICAIVEAPIQSLSLSQPLWLVHQFAEATVIGDNTGVLYYIRKRLYPRVFLQPKVFPDSAIPDPSVVLMKPIRLPHPCDPVDAPISTRIDCVPYSFLHYGEQTTLCIGFHPDHGYIKSIFEGLYHLDPDDYSFSS